MKTTHYDEREFTASLYSHAGPALAWAALLAFFAVAGAWSHDEPRQIAQAAPVLVQMVNESDDVPALVHSAFGVPSPREPVLRDGAILAHEALDPVSVGLNTVR